MSTTRDGSDANTIPQFRAAKQRKKALRLSRSPRRSRLRSRHLREVQMRKTIIARLMRQCDQLSEQMAALVEAGRAVPPAQLKILLARAMRLHVTLQAEMRLAMEAN